MEEKEVKNVEKNGSEVSHSKQKRQEREKKQKSAKRGNTINNIIWPVIAVIFVVAIVALIIGKIVSTPKTIVASSDLGAELDDNGFIKGVKATDYITLFDYKNIKIPASEVTYTDEEMNADIESVLESHMQVNTESKDAIKDGDTVNIDYVGSVDGVEFEGGNSNGQGYELTIGSGSFIDDFEQQLIGYKVGEVVNVNVDFPENYTEDLAGKNADFVVTINGIYEKPELTDDFVATSLAAYASTVDEYKAYLKKNAEEEKITNYIGEYVKNNTVVNKYPKKFLEKLESTTRYSDEETYKYMNQMYMQYYGSGYSSFEEYIGMPEEEYIADLETRAKDSCLIALADQAILESEGVNFTPEDVKAYVVENYGSEENFDSMVEEYGLGYLASDMIPDKVLEILKGYATIE